MVKTTLYKKYETVLLAVISIIGGFYIDAYYSSFMPDFDIGFYEAFASFRCWILILILWGIETILLYIVKKHIDNKKSSQLLSIAIMVIYWIIIWMFCYYQYIIKAAQDWNDMMNGNIG